MILAAIDIGSNALRLLIKVGTAQDIIQSLDTLGPHDYHERIALKSGRDTFVHGHITQPTELRLTLALHRFAQIMRAHGVEAYRACATSAYRDASNGPEVIERANQATGLNVEIITGDEEARITRRSFVSPTSWRHHTTAFADVGGGSTEISILRNEELIYAHSFNIGSMRQELDLNQLAILSAYATPSLHLIAIGGSIRFMTRHILAHTTLPTKQAYPFPSISTESLEREYTALLAMTPREISAHYHAPMERAEILRPAISIFVSIAHRLCAPTIHVPSIGVRYGIIADLIANLPAR